MFIVYSSNTGHTRQYAQMLSEALDIPAYDLKTVPPTLDGLETIYMGWLMAGSVVGYAKAAKKFKIRCVVGVGMTPESAEQTEDVAKKVKPGAGVPVFYLQGGYDFNKLGAMHKMMMKAVTPSILKRFDGKSEAEKEADPTYRMITRGDSVVSAERLEPVIRWYRATEK